MKPRRFKLEAIILVCALLVVSAGVVLQSRRAAIDETKVIAANMAALLAEQSRMAFQSTDVALHSMIAWLEREAFDQDDIDYRVFIRALNNRLQFVRALFVIGPDGYILHDTDFPDTPRVSLEDRRYFQALRDDPTLEVFVGRPIRSRSVQSWFVPVARRFETPDGRFAGIVVAAVEPLFVERTYGRLQLHEDDSVALFHDDTTLVASIPPRPDLYGKALDDIELFETHLSRASNGVYQAVNRLTGQPSVIGYEKLENFPLLVTVALDQSEALAGWQRFVWVVLFANIFTISLILLLYSTMARRQLERQIARQKALMQEKLETIGFMTSGVAHDFKNLLAALGAGVKMLRRKGADETLLVKMEEAMERGIGLTNELLRFAKGHEISKVIFCPDAQITGLEGLLRGSLGMKVDLTLDLRAGAARVDVSPAFFDAALMNLAVNASQAMPDGGDLRFSTRVVGVSGHARLDPGSYVSISVEDTGHGIAQGALKTLFQPFVTTKGMHGTGLGLYQTRKFALECGGDIEVESEIGKGTKIDILLPCIEPKSL